MISTPTPAGQHVEFLEDAANRAQAPGAVPTSAGTHPRLALPVLITADSFKQDTAVLQMVHLMPHADR
jgi:hypothetical protein